MGQIIRLYEEHTNEKQLREVVKALEAGAVIIYPTDTLYALGCSMNSIKAINRIKEIKRKDTDDLSLVCPDLSKVSDYARIDNRIFKILKRNTPGAFTFILPASNNIPNKFLERKRTVGIRIPRNRIPVAITEMLGAPLVSTSLTFSSLDEEDTINPELIWEEYKNTVDILVDGGYASLHPSTVVDLSEGTVEIIRQGEAVLEEA